ncbi:MAG: response regulator transcription factor [Aurantibacter sp.]
MRKTVFIFAALVIALLGLFKLSKYVHASGDASIELIIAIIALVFFFIGIYLNKKSLHKNLLPKKYIDKKKIEEAGLSKREYEVLREIVRGLSNKEIGDKMYLSESTIKTHVSNLYIKLDAKRRTQAIQKAKEMQII